MIRDEHQRQVAQTQRDTLAASLAALLHGHTGQPRQLVEIQRASLEGLIADLDAKLREYQQTGGGSAEAGRARTAAATAAVVRRGQDKMAAKLTAGGWVVVPPERLTDTLPDLPDDATVADWAAARGLPPTITLKDLITHELALAATLTRTARGDGV